MIADKALPTLISFVPIKRYDLKYFALNPVTYKNQKISREKWLSLNLLGHSGHGGKCWGVWYLFIRMNEEYYLKIDNLIVDLKRDNLRIVWFRKNQMWARFELWKIVEEGKEKLLHGRSYLIHPCTNAFDTPGRLARSLTSGTWWQDIRNGKELTPAIALDND